MGANYLGEEPSQAEERIEKPKPECTSLLVRCL
jgi:hypothetical protein